jgi:glyoxylase-like metal-dependent hydrolase (beta-lactamase superfamily II)
MASANQLTTPEIRLIKAMLQLLPKPTYQEILAYFTRPLRDINHRVIAEIDNGWHSSREPAAKLPDAMCFMSAMENMPRPNPGDFSCNDSVSAKDQMNALLNLNWWPVGQGLFSSGYIVRPKASPLSWVYDCGTTSKDKFLDIALHEFRKLQTKVGNGLIHVAVISHFDKDHISGFVRLIQHSPINTLLLPYVPLWQRLLMAIEQNLDATDPRFAFFVDPVAYFYAVEGSQIGQIAFVPPAGPDDAPPGPPDVGPEGPRETIDGDLTVEWGEAPPASQGDPATEPKVKGQARFLKHGGRILSPMLWEFVPYNDAQMAPMATPAFSAAVAPLLDCLKNDVTKRAQALIDIKVLYDKTFGSSSKQRNIVSLFLYSGPVDNRQVLKTFIASHNVHPSATTTRFGQMYTGDAFLDTGARFDRFKRYYSGGNRLGKAGLLQVMHHGARKNWHKGIADQLEPVVSLFSSDPGHRGYKHPHAKVLREFWPYHPVQIDTLTGFHFKGGITGR